MTLHPYISKFIFFFQTVYAELYVSFCSSEPKAEAPPRRVWTKKAENIKKPEEPTVPSKVKAESSKTGWFGKNKPVVEEKKAVIESPKTTGLLGKKTTVPEVKEPESPKTGWFGRKTPVPEEKKLAPETPKTGWFGSKAAVPEEKKSAPESPKTGWFGRKTPVPEEKKLAPESPKTGWFGSKAALPEEKKPAPESPKTGWFGKKEPVIEDNPKNGKFSSIVKANEEKNR